MMGILIECCYIFVACVYLVPDTQDVLDMAGDYDTDEQILKRMEEILFTYKTKVEDKLAAEGKVLPKVR